MSKEKAKELVEKYFKMGDIYPVTTHGHAKQCAIIHCDEMILELRLCRTASEAFLYLTKRIEFYESVKSEISNL